ncbi:MAG TPA: HAD-IB family hydrolase, partial [Gaiellaceae bacterium]|nr:HAD-IB family hydrolase [Gaiellaceae bacterium]
MIRAAFFDLDRTFIRRSSALALAGAFRERGIISRRQLVKAGLWQLLFAARGADPQTVTNGIADGVALIRGVPAADVEQMATDAVDTVLWPLVYPDALMLAHEHRRRGEPVYLVTASLQEIVGPFAAALGLDGVIASIGEIDADGRYTGAVVRACHGAGKAAAIGELEGIDLAGSTAYSDGVADLPLLETV